MTIELEKQIDAFSRLVDVDYVHENNLFADSTERFSFHFPADNLPGRIKISWKTTRPAPSQNGLVPSPHSPA
jgi:hypothetical protein